MGNAGAGNITHAQAAEILGVTKSVVNHLVQRGHLTSNGTRGRGNASLDRAQVRRLAAKRARAQAERERLAALPKPDRRPQPPDDVHEWLTTNQAAAIVGISGTAMKIRCNRGTQPFEWHDGWRWFRRDLLELRERAREAQASREP